MSSSNYHGFEEHANDPGWIAEGEQIYESWVDYFSERYSQWDQDATDLLWTGWFDPDVETFERQMARAFLQEDYDIDKEVIDSFWDDWRDWYESTT